MSHLELYARYTTAVFDTLNELRVKTPAASSIPSGVRLSRQQNSISHIAPTAKTVGPEKDMSEVYSAL